MKSVGITIQEITEKAYSEYKKYLEESGKQWNEEALKIFVKGFIKGHYYANTKDGA